MRIQCNEKFWDKVANYCDGDNEPMLTWDKRAKVIAFQNEDGKRLEFESMIPLDPIDMPVTIRVPVGDNIYFNTDTFQIEEQINWEDIPKRDNPPCPEPIEDEKIPGDPRSIEKALRLPEGCVLPTEKVIKDVVQHKDGTYTIYFLDGMSMKVDPLELIKDDVKFVKFLGEIESIEKTPEEIDSLFDDCPKEKAVKLIGSLNNDLRRLFKGKIESDIHVSQSDRIVNTLNKILSVGDELIEQRTPLIDLIIKNVRKYEQGDFGCPGCVAKEKLAKRIVNILLNNNFILYGAMEAHRDTMYEELGYWLDNEGTIFTLNAMRDLLIKTLQRSYNDNNGLFERLGREREDKSYPTYDAQE